MNLKFYFCIFSFLFIFNYRFLGQPVAGFNLPDSACVGSTINLNNFSTGGTTYFWNFCSGNIINNPTGTNIGNPGNLLNIPTYLTLAQDNNDCYSFISCPGLPAIVRYFHGSTFSNSPISWTNLGNFGILGDKVEGIQIKKDAGLWYGIIVDYNSLIRLTFGNSLNNFPTSSIIGTYPEMQMGHCLLLYKENNNWIAFVSCTTGKKILRFNFGNSLINNPIIQDFGNLGGVITNPTQMSLVVSNNISTIFVANGGFLTRLDFGTSFLNNNPQPVNLGNFSVFTDAGSLTILKDCDSISGYFCKYLNPGILGKINFNNGIWGTPTGSTIGNIGNLNLPHSFSEIFRSGDTLFAYVTNRGSHTLTRFTFPPCTNASIPSSTLYNPPAFSYNQPGTYNVRLLINENLPDQVSLCKTIVVVPPPTLTLGPDINACNGQQVLLDAGPGFSSYLWSTGEMTQTISVTNTGSYMVTATKYGCSVSDAVNVTFSTIADFNLGPDTTVCAGQNVTFSVPYVANSTCVWINAQNGQTIGSGFTFTTSQPGTYVAKVTDQLSCTKQDTITLSNHPVPNTGSAPSVSTICSGTSPNISLFSNQPGTTFSWITTSSSLFLTGNLSGSGNSINQILTNTGTQQEFVVYNITPSLSGCIFPSIIDTVKVNPLKPTSIIITATDTSICQGTEVNFSSITTFPGTNPFYLWKVNGLASGSNTSTFTYTPNNNDLITCTLISSETGCITQDTVISNSIRIHSSTPLSASVTISANNVAVCAGNTVNFNSIGQNGGTNPIFQWKVNNISVYTGQSFSYQPNNNDVVSCIMTSSISSCISNNPAESDTIKIITHPLNTINVAISTPQNSICSGTQVTLTATTNNGGSSPVYQWFLNDINVFSGGDTYTYIPSNNDNVFCKLNSSLTLCTLNNPATSNAISFSVIPNLPVSVAISSSKNPVCEGLQITLTAIPVNGGTSPGYQWFRNGLNLGIDSPTLSLIPDNIDVFYCNLNSSLSCKTGNPASSNSVIINVTSNPLVSFSSCFDTITTINAKPFLLKGGIPIGGTFSGPGVNGVNNTFNPSASGTGQKIIHYSYTNAGTCTAEKTLTIHVYPSPTFNCGDLFRDIRDNSLYKTVKIGNQCWFAENLKYGNQISSSVHQRDNCFPEKYCPSSNCDSKDGSFYQWDEVMCYSVTEGEKGFCPPGWHIPIENEWNILFSNWTNNAFAGSALKYTGFSGFKASLPGASFFNETFRFTDFAGFFWSSSSHGSYKAWAYPMNGPDYSVAKYPSSRSNAFSVRCIKD